MGGQVENTEVWCQTEVQKWKPKYESEKKPHLSVFSTFLYWLTIVCFEIVAKRWLDPCDVSARS